MGNVKGTELDAIAHEAIENEAMRELVRLAVDLNSGTKNIDLLKGLGHWTHEEAVFLQVTELLRKNENISGFKKSGLSRAPLTVQPATPLDMG